MIFPGQSHVHFDINTGGRDFVVGDVHGHLVVLQLALRAVDFDERVDRLFALGDLVDRGPQSAELLRLVESAPWFFSLRGNHEAMLHAASKVAPHSEPWRIWRHEGSWALEQPDMQHLADIAGALPLTIEVALRDGRTVGLVHAEVPVGLTWDETKMMELAPGDEFDMHGSSAGSSLLWGRRRISLKTELAVPGVDLVLCGHTMLEERIPRLSGNVRFIETGAFRIGGRLTIVEPLAMRYWQVTRRDEWANLIDQHPTPLPAT